MDFAIKITLLLSLFGYLSAQEKLNGFEEGNLEGDDIWAQIQGAKPVRLLRQRQKCKPPRQCRNHWSISKKTLVHGKVKFLLSDQHGRRHTSLAWKAVLPQGNHYKAKNGQKEVDLVYSLRDGAKFQAREFCVWVKNVAQIVAIYCDSTDPLSLTIYCNFNRRNDLEGYPIQARPTNTGIFTKHCINRWIPVTHVWLIFFLDTSARGGIEIYGLTAFVCTDDFFVKHGNPRFGLESRKRDKLVPTTEKCLKVFHLKYPRRGQKINFFNFNDSDTSRNELNVLAKSQKIYTGQKGKRVIFSFSASDGDDIMWWTACLTVRNAKSLSFFLETKSETILQNREICEPGNWTHICYKQHKIIVRGVIHIKLPPGVKNKAIQVQKMKISVCRDHHYYKVKLHRNPGDYKIMTLDTMTNQTINIYGRKNSAGEIRDTELYHFTDHTGNLGDDIWYRLDPKIKLITAIWSPKDYLKFDWNLKAKRLLVTIIYDGTFITDILIDTQTLKKVKKAGFTPVVTNPKPCKRCLTIPIQLKQCREPMDNNLVLASIRGPKGFTQIPARHTGRPGRYEIIIPKQSQDKISDTELMELCKVFNEVKSRECKLHYRFIEEQYRLICVRVQSVLNKYSDIPRDGKLRIFHTCLNAFKKTDTVCTFIQKSVLPLKPSYLQSLCNERTNITTPDLFDKVFKTDQSFTTQIKSRDIFSRQLKSAKQIQVTGNFKPLNLVEDTFAMLNIYKEPVPKRGQKYKLIVEYNCGKDGRRGYVYLGVVVNLVQGIPAYSGTRCSSTHNMATNCSIEVNPDGKNSSGYDEITLNYVASSKRPFSRRIVSIY